MQNSNVMIPPHSMQAEEATIGSLIIDPDAIFYVSDFLKPNDFYIAKHRMIYQAILDMADDNELTDIITVSHRVARNEGTTYEQWFGLLSQLSGLESTSINVKQYAQIVVDKSTRRRMIRAAEKMGSAAYDEEGDLVLQLDDAESSLFEVRGDDAEGVSKPRQYVSEFMAHIDRVRRGEVKTGMMTGFADIDRVLGGLVAPNMYVIAGRPAMGKSAFSGAIATRLAVNQGKKVMMFSLEMSKAQIMRRNISRLTGINSKRLRDMDLPNLSQGETEQVYEAMGRISESGLFIDDTPGLTAGQIRAKCLRIKSQHGLDLVIIDYLNLMNHKDVGNRNQEVGNSTKEIAQLCKVLNVPIILVAQISRGVENRQNKRPLLSDLRDSGEIEEFTHTVIFLYRDEYYDPNTITPNVADVIIAKNKDGETGIAQLFWKPENVTFKNLAKETAL